MQNASELEGIVELDAQADADIIALIAAYKEAKDAEAAVKAQIDLAKEAMDKAFAERGVMGKGKLMLNGKPLISRNLSSRTTFDKDILFRLAPAAARKAMKVSEFSVFRRPQG
jgi:hypothetical protein